MFSSRVPHDLAPNRLTSAELALRRAGVRPIDLTETNPTRVGLPYPPALLAPLADPRSLVYEPHPFGLAVAREAVAREYGAAGLPLDPSRVVLTSSTSEAYSLLFKLLCNPNDEVLVPVPSYPLFEHLTRLDLVEVRTYPLEYHGAWSVDAVALARAITPRTRAILVVSPNNPTGSILTRGDLERIVDLCAADDLALVGDEVFADYLIDPRPDRVRVLEQERALAFSLGGLSKSVGLPQVKLGWMAASGPPALVESALARLEIVCDAYLSVSTPVQQAAAWFLEEGRETRRRILDRVTGNLQRLQQAAARCRWLVHRWLVDCHESLCSRHGAAVDRLYRRYE